MKDLSEGMPFSRDTFVKKVLLETCKFEPRDIYCLQDFPGNGYFDVTFALPTGWQKFMKDLQEKGNEAPMSLLKVQPLFTLPNQKERMFNPHVPVVDVLTFLARYVDGAGNCVDVKDLHGIWTSKRQAKVKLRVDKEGALLHPPSVFAIGGNRGYLSYVGQPRLCRKCNKPGHVVAQCTAVVCKNCKTEGHETKDCQASKNCNLCGEGGHLYRACPKRACSYAQATRGAVSSTPRAGETPTTTAKPPAERGNRDGDSPTTSSPQVPEELQHQAQEGESIEEEGGEEQNWTMVKHGKHQKGHKEQRPEGVGKRKKTPKKWSLSLTEGSNLSSSSDDEATGKPHKKKTGEERRRSLPIVHLHQEIESRAAVEGS